MSEEYYDFEGRPLRSKWLRNTIVTVVVLVILFTGWRVVNARRVNRALAALQQAGYPTTMEELERMYYPNIPPNQNAAFYYGQVFSQFTVPTTTNKPSSSSWSFGSLPRTGELWPREDMERIARMVEMNQGAIAALRSNFPATNSRYPIVMSQGFSMILPHLSRISEAERYLIADAALNADAGRTEVALDDLDAAFRLANSLQYEPILISQLSRLRYRSVISSTMERMLNRGPLSDEQLVRISNAFATNDYPPAFERAIAGELCMGVLAFNMTARERAALFSSGPSNAEGNSSGAVLVALMAVSGLKDRDQSFYLRTMSEYLRLSRVEFPQRLDEAGEIEAQVEGQLNRGHYLYSKLLLPSIGGANLREAEYVARLRLVQSALAVERYRLANGDKVPETLNVLTPRFFATVPADPFDGKPLRYHKLDKGYMLYSIGRDRKDDGGVLRDPKKPGSGEDIIFRVER